MRSFLSRLVRLFVRFYIKPRLNNHSPIGKQRRVLRRVGNLLLCTKGAKRERYHKHGRQGEWVTHDSVPDDTKRVLIYIHGGAFTMGSPHTHAPITTHLAKHYSGKVLAVDYALAPEHVFPAALNDLVASYNALLQQGYAAENITLAGDSAGGNLVIAMVVKLRELNEPLPAAISCLSPWVDLTLSGESITALRKRDPLVSNGWLQRNAQEYANGIALDDPRLSPLFADLTGLPPTYIQVGSDEILLSDAQNLHAQLTKHGVASELDVWEGMWHVWQGAGFIVPESRRALRKIARFLARHTAS